MKKTMWYVDWEDLSVICPTRERAIEYMAEEAFRIDATLTVVYNDEFDSLYRCRWYDGSVSDVFIIETEVIE